MQVEHAAKRIAARLVGSLRTVLRYPNMIVLISHMRSSSTALSNVICSRPDVNGYGETHVPHDNEHSPAMLAINHWRRNATSAGARYQFDKILHNELDCAPPPSFFTARAVFLLREPAPTIRSICEMSAKLGKQEYAKPEKAAAYYIGRVEQMQSVYGQFTPARRIALTHAALMRDPELALQRISDHLAIAPALTNAYESHPMSSKPGGGDPLNSAKWTRIERFAARPVLPMSELGIDEALAQRASAAHARLLAILTTDPANLI